MPELEAIAGRGEEVREQLTFHPVMTIGEVIDLALEPERVGLRA